MTISDEILMAYADGELDAAAGASVELAMREDPLIAARVARHRALRLQVEAAYAAELADEVPQRLLTAVRGAGDVQASPDRGAARRRRWRTVGTLAASVAAGVGVGFLIWGRAGSPFVRGAGGELLARGQLARALSSQLVAEQSSRSGRADRAQLLGQIRGLLPHVRARPPRRSPASHAATARGGRCRPWYKVPAVRAVPPNIERPPQRCRRLF